LPGKYASWLRISGSENRQAAGGSCIFTLPVPVAQQFFPKSDGFGKHRFRLEEEFEVGSGKVSGCCSGQADSGSGDFGRAKKIMRFDPATLDTCKV
jgi:hypothetical protein